MSSSDDTGWQQTSILKEKGMMGVSLITRKKKSIAVLSPYLEQNDRVNEFGVFFLLASLSAVFCGYFFFSRPTLFL